MEVFGSELVITFKKNEYIAIKVSVFGLFWVIFKPGPPYYLVKSAILMSVLVDFLH